MIYGVRNNGLLRIQRSRRFGVCQSIRDPDQEERGYCYYLGIKDTTLRKIQADERKADIGSIDVPVRGLEDNLATIGDTVIDPEDKYEHL